MTGTKYALVTGGNRGIGLEVCKALVAHGKPVLLTSRNLDQGVSLLVTCSNEVHISVKRRNNQCMVH